MTDIASLIVISGAFFVITASRGTATLALASASMSSGRVVGLKFCSGLTIGLAIGGAIAATGLGTILQTSNQALSFIKMIGGVYLLWLAWRSAKSALSKKTNKTITIDTKKSFSLGMILNLSNPQAVFAWMATLALGASASTGATQVIVATVICVIISFIVYAFYAFVFSTAKVMNSYNKARKSIDAVVACLFIIAGIALIKSAF